MSTRRAARMRRRVTWFGTLIAVMVAVAIPLYLLGASRAVPVPAHALAWWAVAVGFLATEVFVIHLDVRRDSHTSSLSEIPLLLGLALASPEALIVGRLLGAGTALVLHRGSRGVKLAFNMALFYLETSAALFVYRTLLADRPQASLGGLAVGALALVVALILGAVLVSLAIVLNQPGRPLGSVLRSMAAGLAISTGSTALAVGGLALYAMEPLSLVAVAALAAVLQGSLRLYGSLNTRYENLEAAFEFTSAIDGAVDTEELVDSTLTSVKDLFDAEYAEVVLSRGVGSTVTTRPVEGPDRLHPAPPAVLAALSQCLAAGHTSFLLSDAPVALADHYRAEGIEDAMFVCLEGGGGTATLIVVGNPRGADFTRGEMELLETLAREARVSFERGRLVDRLRREVGQKEYQALHDALTGLPNRLHFNIAVEEAVRRARQDSTRVAVLLIDLDRFKEVNDTLGHQRGDSLLQDIAMRLSEAVGGEEYVARLGGDEFGIVLREVDGVLEASEWARKIGDLVQRPFLSEGLSIQVTGSIGIALAPEHGSDGATLLRRADVAMYEAKSGGSTFEVYDPHSDGYSTRRLALAGELRHAIESGELAVHYQPKASLADGAVTGVEALARWHHPRHGIVTPDEFIVLAQRTGLIRRLTEHVLRAALRDMSRLRGAGHELSVAVNIAASSLNDPEFPDLIVRLLDEYHTSPDLLVLEVTESTMMADSARARLVLAALDEVGVGLAIDDYGTGYSSLSYLSRLPVDQVKVDRSFVMDMAVDERLAKIVTSTVSLVHSLGMEVVAEGVENGAVWDLLREAGCDQTQGFYVAHPMGLADLTTWLSSGMQFHGESGRYVVPEASSDR